MQKITTPGFTSYGLNLKTVQILGDGLKRKVTPVSYNNTVKGELQVVLPVEFVYGSVTILIDSELTTSVGRRVLTQSKRFLAETGTVLEGAHATIESATIACIKTSESASCPTCAEQQKYGATEPACAGQVSDSNEVVDDKCCEQVLLALGLLVMAMLI